MAVAAYHAAVKAYVADFHCRHSLKLCGEEISFYNAVFFVEYFHYIKLYELTARIALKRKRADKNIQLFALYYFTGLAAHLACGKVRQKVCYNKLRVALVFAYIDLRLAAVSFNNHAVKRHRNRCPLVFFYSAVIMGFEKGNVGVFIKRIGL